MAASIRQKSTVTGAVSMALMTLAGGLGSSAGAQGSAQHEHVRIGPMALDAELTRVANALAGISDGKPNLAQLYMIMQDACKTAMQNGAHPPSGSIATILQENYCTCDALLTIDDWLKNSEMTQRLVAFNAAPNQSDAQLILANHRIYEHDAVCGAAFKGTE